MYLFLISSGLFLIPVNILWHLGRSWDVSEGSQDINRDKKEINLFLLHRFIFIFLYFDYFSNEGLGTFILSGFLRILRIKHPENYRVQLYAVYIGFLFPWKMCSMHVNKAVSLFVLAKANTVDDVRITVKRLSDYLIITTHQIQDKQTLPHTYCCLPRFLSSVFPSMCNNFQVRFLLKYFILPYWKSQLRS